MRRVTLTATIGTYVPIDSVRVIKAAVIAPWTSHEAIHAPRSLSCFRFFMRTAERRSAVKTENEIEANLFRYGRLALKNFCMSSRHSASRMPETTSKRWLWPGSSPPRTVEMTAPDLGSAAP